MLTNPVIRWERQQRSDCGVVQEVTYRMCGHLMDPSIDRNY
jgi:hypothetical protein